MKKSFYLLICLLSILITVNGQESDVGSKIDLRTTPNNFERVNENVFSIPIYDIVIDGVNIPISIEYNTSGVRVNDEPSFLGLNWDLSYGPKILRHVNSIADEQQPIEIWQLPDEGSFYEVNGEYTYKGRYGEEGEWGGWLRRTLPHDLGDYYYVDPPSSSLPSNSWKSHVILHNVHDANPDEYSLLLNDKSYNFLITEGGLVKNKRYVGIEIDQNLITPESYPFEVKDNKGIKFSFIKGNNIFSGNRGTAHTCFDPTLIPNDFFSPYCDRFVIENIKINDNKNITFQYSTSTFDERLTIYHKKEYVIDNIGGQEFYNNTCKRKVRKLLELITTPKETIEFEYEEYIDTRYQGIANDYGLTSTANQTKLTKILIYDNNGVFKKGYRFTYGTHENNKLKLTSICLYADEVNEQIFRSFKYVPISTTDLTKQDYYSYYNDNNTGHLYPHRWDGSIGADRNYDDEKIKSGILNEIVYSTGGKVEIDYAPNAYIDEAFDESLYAGGVYPSEITFYDTDNTFISSVNYNSSKLTGFVEDQTNNGALYFKENYVNATISPWVLDEHARYSSSPIKGYVDIGHLLGSGFKYYEKGYFFCEKEIIKKDHLGNSNGKIVQKFSLDYLSHSKKGILQEERVYNDNNGLVKETKYQYNYEDISEEDIDYIQGIYLEDTRTKSANFTACSWSPWVKSYLLYERKFYHDIDFKLTQKNISEFFNGHQIQKTEKYEYNSNNRIHTLTTNTSDEQTVETEYLYLSDFSYIPESHQYTTLLSDNFDQPYLVNKWLIKDSHKFLLSSTINVYDMNGHVIEIHQAELDNPLPETEYQYPFFDTKWDEFVFPQNIYKPFLFLKYDIYGNVIEENNYNKNVVSYIWGNNYSQLIAKIENTDYSNIMDYILDSYGHSIEDIQNMENQGLVYLFNEMRSDKSDIMISSYTYNLLYGVESHVDHSGYEMLYNYDLFGRLKTIKDKEGSILKHYEYHFYE